MLTQCEHYAIKALLLVRCVFTHAHEQSFPCNGKADKEILHCHDKEKLALPVWCNDNANSNLIKSVIARFSLLDRQVSWLYELYMTT